MDWTIEQLRAFVTAAEKGSFSAAARALNKAQSVVSTHVSMLEDCLGVELFDRSSRYPSLTDAGADMLSEARAVLRQSRRFDSCALARFKGESTRLDIAASYGIPIQFVSTVVAEISKTNPFLTGSFSIMPTEKLWNAVSEGSVHAGILNRGLPDMGDRCDQICIGQMHYCAVASKDSPLAALEVVTEQDLIDYRQIIVSGAEYRKYLLSSTYWQVNDLICALYWASLGIGWTVVPRGLAVKIQEEGTIPNLAILNMEQLDKITINLFLVWNLDFARRDIMDKFIQGMKRAANEAASSGLVL